MSDVPNINIEYREASLSDRSTIRQVLEDRCYSIMPFPRHAQALLLWMEHCTKTPLIIDAGANIGCASVYFAQCYPAAHILAVEPEQGNCVYLLKNTASRSNVHVVQAAIGPHRGVGHIVDPGRGDWAFRVSSGVRHGQQAVLVMTMAELLELGARAVKQPIAPFIFKCDIEGGERELFGQHDWGWFASFPLVMIETHDWLLPGSGCTHNLTRALAHCDFDLTHAWENLFCWNNALLRQYYDAPARQLDHEK